MPSPKMMLTIALIALVAVAVANRIPQLKTLVNGTTA